MIAAVRAATPEPVARPFDKSLHSEMPPPENEPTAAPDLQDEPIPYELTDDQVRSARRVGDATAALLNVLTTALADHQAAADDLTAAEVRYAIHRIRQHTDVMRSTTRALTDLATGEDL